ncbi:MAG: ribokinase [Patescibacteria group bacterium]|nr:MAG: ribokinase [Patescibacteria group bacterium]
MQLVISGSMSVDQIMIFGGTFESLIQPEKLHVLSIAPLVDKLKRTRGGTAGNIAYSLALLGEKPVLLASVGSESQEYIDDLQKIGVDTTYVHFSKLHTATFSVLTDKNNCQVGGFYPGAMSDATTLTLKKFENRDILMVISAHDPQGMATQISECKRLHKRFLFDPGQQSLILSKAVLQEGIKRAEIVIVNDYEMGLLVKRTGWSQKEIVGKLKVCIVTLGEKGSKIWVEGKLKRVPAVILPAEEVVDPTGAGDAFRAGFLYGYVRDWEVATCAKLGSVIASFVVACHGTQEHSINWEQIKKRYEETYKESLEGVV